jgi:hypothetical protein
MSKITVTEKEARITWMKKRIGQRGPDKHDRVGEAIEEFQVARDTANLYFDEALSQLHKKAEQSVEKHRQDAIVVYDSIINDPTSKKGERTQAQKQKDLLLGTQAPRQVQVTGSLNIALDLDRQRQLLTSPEAIAAANLLDSVLIKPVPDITTDTVVH